MILLRFFDEGVPKFVSILKTVSKSPCDGPYFCRLSITLLRCLQRPTSRQHIGNFLSGLLYSAVWVSIPFAEHLLSGYNNVIDSILLLPSLCRALEPISNTSNGISLGLDCSIVATEACKLDSLFITQSITSVMCAHVSFTKQI